MHRCTGWGGARVKQGELPPTPPPPPQKKNSEILHYLGNKSLTIQAKRITPNNFFWLVFLVRRKLFSETPCDDVRTAEGFSNFCWMKSSTQGVRRSGLYKDQYARAQYKRAPAHRTAIANDMVQIIAIFGKQHGKINIFLSTL